MSNDIKVADALAKSWVYRLLPQRLWPFAQLARWERPIGWQLLLMPCLWSLALAANYYRHENGLLVSNKLSTDMTTVLVYIVLFILGAIAMRGAGCTYNDLVDQDIDTKVARTRSRPLPSGRVTRKNAYLFLAAQLLAGLLILLQFNTYAVIVGFVSVLTIIIYPFMKRITWWPQLFLGFAFSWGALLAWSAIAGQLHAPAFLLYAGSICWVIGYDTIYAHQDIEDDMVANVKSTARLFAEHTKPALSILYSAALILFAGAIWLATPLEATPWLSWFSLALGAVHLFWQVWTLDINNPQRCLKLFKSNAVFGLILLVGFVGAIFV